MFNLEIKKKWSRLAAVLLVPIFLFFPIYFGLSDTGEIPLICRSFPESDGSFFGQLINKVFGATFNAGSIFTVCTSLALQPTYTTEDSPSVTLYWTFSSPVGNTQKSYRVQIDDNADFNSVIADTGTVASASARSYVSNYSLSFDSDYNWRLMIVDNNNSVTDWIEGDSFRTGSPSAETAKQQAREQEINLQTTISSRSYE